MPSLEIVRQLVKRFEENKERVAREIESTDRAIDRLVYELSCKGMISRMGTMYGLSEDEVKIVEGNCPPSRSSPKSTTGFGGRGLEILNEYICHYPS